MDDRDVHVSLSLIRRGDYDSLKVDSMVKGLFDGVSPQVEYVHLKKYLFNLK